MMMEKIGWNNWLLILGVVVLAVVPLLIVQDSEFGGADGEAEAVIGEVNPDYEPWFEPLIELPGGETESLLFVSQGAIGSGIVGFVIGRYKGRSERNEKSD